MSKINLKTRALAAVLCTFAVIAVPLATNAGADNGAPRGAHDYQLNIIGTGDKNPDMTGNNGHRIFVPLEGKTKINLVEGDYAVLDANGTDTDGATFQLPAPGLDAYEVGDPGSADVVSSYSVFIRPLGKPGGWATITTCADLVESTASAFLSAKELKTVNGEALEGDECSLEQVGTDILTRKTGKSSFTDVTAELLTMVFDIVYVDGNDVEQTITIRVPIFDPLVEGEYWEYDNGGLRLAQVRFYDCSTNVETGASNC